MGHLVHIYFFCLLFCGLTSGVGFNVSEALSNGDPTSGPNGTSAPAPAPTSLVEIGKRVTRAGYLFDISVMLHSARLSEAAHAPGRRVGLPEAMTVSTVDLSIESAKEIRSIRVVSVLVSDAGPKLAPKAEDPPTRRV
jgi:hypothetical protein